MRLISADGRWWWKRREWKPLPKAMDDESGADAPADIEHPAPAEPFEVVKDNGNRRFMPGHYPTASSRKHRSMWPEWSPTSGSGCERACHQPGSTPQERQHLRLDADIACADEEIHALPGEFATGLSLGRSVSGAAEPA